MKSLTEIRALFNTLESEQELNAFIDEFGSDGRVGVGRLTDKARKKITDIDKEKARTHNMYHYERENIAFSPLCGIDEVGRGPLAGPVYAAAVILPQHNELLYLNDSKQLSEKRREELYDVIMEKAIAVGIGHVSPQRIDEINILQATYEAMTMAVKSLMVSPKALLIDAVHIPQLEEIRQISIVKGDTKSASIAAASIIAKVTRDRVMKDLSDRYPQYNFASNKGYGSQEHIEAIKKFGLCEIHRRSFTGNFV
ncbi:MAG: ribonuclease HII [Butyrivibrio sp.]|nr:ribonuclease HII [Butyrivibrio sp.]